MSGVMLSVLIGLITGLGAIVFRWLIALFHNLTFNNGVVHLDSWFLPLVMAAGGLTVGLLVYFFAQEARGHGVPEVMLAVAAEGGRIRGRVALIKSLASSICIGTGGSAGREGPIVQIGSALGSALGQKLHLPDKKIALMVACGASAGIAATFNAPVAGVFFSLEVILREFATSSFSYVVLSSVTASVVGRALLGNDPAFVSPSYSVRHPGELFFYRGLGLLCAIVGYAYSRILYAFEDFFDGLRLYTPLKPAIGAAAVGLLALAGIPQVMGVGYDTITQALNGDLTVKLMLLLVLGKLLATSLTLGSGGSGGVFAPSLFMGAMLGGCYGSLAQWLAPGIVGSPGGYALVGMSALFAASAHAPITAILILFELTGDYRLILPLMFATVLSTMVAKALGRDSIYTIKLLRRGIDLEKEHGLPRNPMLSIAVGEVMCTDYDTVEMDLPLVELAERFNRTGRHGFAVVERGQLRGIVTLKDLEYARLRAVFPLAERRVRDIATLRYESVCPQDSLHTALRIMGRLAVGRIPVVEATGSSNLVGILRRDDIIRAYDKALQEQPLSDEVESTLKVGSLGGHFFEIMLPDDTPLNSVKVRDIQAPKDSILVAIRHEGQLLIPHGDTVLKGGDVVLAFTRSEHRDELRRFFARSSGSGTTSEAPVPLPLNGHSTDASPLALDTALEVPADPVPVAPET